MTINTKKISRVSEFIFLNAIILLSAPIWTTNFYDSEFIIIYILSIVVWFLCSLLIFLSLMIEALRNPIKVVLTYLGVGLIGFVFLKLSYFNVDKEFIVNNYSIDKVKLMLQSKNSSLWNTEYINVEKEIKNLKNNRIEEIKQLKLKLDKELESLIENSN